MQPTVPIVKNNPLDEYQAIIDECFYRNEQSGQAVHEQRHVKQPYFDAVDALNKSSTTTWDELLNDLRDAEGITHLRNVIGRTMTSLRAYLFMDGSVESGICLHLSFIGKLIGFTYIQQGQHHNPKPVRPYHSKSPNQNISYLPYNDGQKDYTKFLNLTIRKHFPDFREFISEYSDHNIPSVQTQEFYFVNIDLFQVLFSSALTEFC